MNTKSLCIAIILLTLTQIALATPAQIVIIRHGEKPIQGNELNQQGCERAYSLPNFFLHNLIVNQFQKPVAIYAATPAKQDSSVRSIEVIAPTAEALGLQINNRYQRDDFSAIVNEINSNAKYDGKTILIAWEHNAIPELASAFGLTLPDGAASWPGNVFDEAWVLNFPNNIIVNTTAEKNQHGSAKPAPLSPPRCRFFDYTTNHSGICIAY